MLLHLMLKIALISVHCPWALDHCLFLRHTLTSKLLPHVRRLRGVVWRISVDIGGHPLLLLRMVVVLLMMLRRTLVTWREVAVGHLLVLLIAGVMLRLLRLTRSGHWPLLEIDLILIEDWRGESS